METYIKSEMVRNLMNGKYLIIKKEKVRLRNYYTYSIASDAGNIGFLNTKPKPEFITDLGIFKMLPINNAKIIFNLSNGYIEFNNKKILEWRKNKQNAINIKGTYICQTDSGNYYYNSKDGFCIYNNNSQKIMEFSPRQTTWGIQEDIVDYQILDKKMSMINIALLFRLLYDYITYRTGDIYVG